MRFLKVLIMFKRGKMLRYFFEKKYFMKISNFNATGCQLRFLYKLAKIARHNSIVLYKFKNGYIANESESNIGRWQYFKYVPGS